MSQVKALRVLIGLYWLCLTNIWERPAWAAATFSSEMDLDSRHSQLQVFWFSHTQRQFFKGYKEATIAYYPFVQTQGQSRGLVVVVNGNSETAYKYRELVWDLFHNGFDVVVYEHRGQGASSPTLPPWKAQNVVHVDSFQDYVSDLSSLVKTIVPLVFPQQTSKPLYLLAHSMGGAVAMEYLVQLGSHSGVAAAALLSPLLGLNTAPIPTCVAYGMFQVGCMVGRGQEMPLVFQLQKQNQDFVSNKTTSSPNRYAFKRSILDEMEQEGYASVKKIGSTAQWFVEASHAADRIMEKPWKLKVPVMIFQAEKDSLVKNANQNKFCRSNPRCQIRVAPGSLHEIYMEKDSIRNPALEQVLQFFEEAAHSAP